MRRSKTVSPSFFPADAGKGSSGGVKQAAGQIQELFNRAAEVFEAAGVKAEMAPLDSGDELDPIAKGRKEITSSGIEAWNEIEDAFESAWTNLVAATERTRADMAGKQ